MEQYLTVFGKKEDEYTRYWVSVSTERMKDGKGTGKYANANMQARLSEDAREVFEDKAGKTKTKGIKVLRMKVSEFYLMAATPKDRDMDDYVYIYVKTAKAAPSKKDDDEEDD